MKKVMFFILALSILLSAEGEQQTVVITGPELVYDAIISLRYPDDNYQFAPDFDALAWTNGGVAETYRSLIKFDLSAIPEGATIVEANILLFNYPNSKNNYGEHSSLSGSNESILSRITESWNDESVTWNNQPSTTSQNEVILEMSTSPNQNYTIDVKSLVQDMIDNPSSSYGFRLKLVTESYYRSMIFASTDNADVSLRPKLIITYSTNTSKQAPISNVRKISATQGGFTGQLDSGDAFSCVEIIGDVDGDGIEDMAVTARRDDDGGTDCGAVWILFMNEDRTVKGYQKISATQGNFSGELDPEDYFGIDIASVGDLDHDGVVDIAVGAWGDDDAGTNGGAVWLLFLNSDGTVKSYQKISATQGGIVGLTANIQFGYSVTSLGDMDGDGFTDIAVGSPTYNIDGGLYKGCVWILFLNQDGTVKAQQKINDYNGGFTGVLDNEDRFGLAVENIGDINGDGIVDIAVNAYYDDDGASNAGAIYILFLNTAGIVQHTQKISALEGNFNGVIVANDAFGTTIVSLGDIDGDGVNDLLTSSFGSDDGGTDRGKAWILYLNSDATVKDYQEINSLNPLLSTEIDNGDMFGSAVAVFSGVNSTGKKEIVISSYLDDDGAPDVGAVYIMDLDVKYKPVAVAGNDQTACGGEILVIDGSKSSVFDNDSLSFQWDCSNYTLTNHTARTLTFEAPAITETTTFDFILTVYCQGIASDPDTASIVVNPRPHTPVISLANGILSSSIETGNQWFLDSVEISGAGSQSVKPVEDGKYQAIVTNEYGCVSEGSNILDLSVRPTALAEGSKIACSGTLINLDGSSSYNPDDFSGDLSYHWSCDKVTVSGNDLPATTLIAPTVSQPTLYDFVLLVSRDEVSSKPDTFTVKINPAPEMPVIEVFGDTLLASHAAGAGYQWYKDLNAINGATDSIYIIPQSGDYRVKVINELGCVSDISDVASVVFSSSNDINYSLKTYPNPTSGWVHVSGLPVNESSDIYVYDSSGRLCLRSMTGNGIANIDLTGFPKGQYLITFSDYHWQSFRVVKE